MSKRSDNMKNDVNNPLSVAGDVSSVQPVFTSRAESTTSDETLKNEKEYTDPQHVENQPNKTSEKLRNPLSGIPKAQLMRDVEKFAEERDLVDYIEELKRGALVAQNGKDFENFPELLEEDKVALREEVTHRWRHPFMMYFMTILCAGSAVVQGMDQTAVNGAQLFYFEEFGLQDNVWLQGLLNGSPYLCSALIGCWTTAPLNRMLGRRGTIFISCLISFGSSFWMAAAHTWWNLLLARFALGFAVGAKSTTTPVYGAECAPAAIRGALVMMWQMFTAAGIMLGFISSVAFFGVTSSSIPGLNWRLMLGSTAIPPMVVCAQVYFCPESPRWYMTKNKYRDALQSLMKLRNTKVQACRDLYSIHAALEIENKMKEGKNLWREFFCKPRNRRAAQSSFFVMMAQQFCGVNVIAYYSSAIFVSSGFSQRDALLVSLGTGIVNFLFAIPAIYTIDTFGRRNLLLTTFPLMSLCLFFTGFSFWIPAGDIENGNPNTARVACIALGIYLFMVVYSPGAGPVPFTYSAEAFPLYVRDIGMSFATATCWGFNFILSLTWPALVEAFTEQGAFSWYAAWNIVGFVFAYFCLPETKGRTLEELDQVFEVSTMKHAKYYKDSIPYYANKYIRRKDVEPRPELYDMY